MCVYVCADLGINAAKCRLDVQRFGHGDYTLLHDTDPHVGEMALDLVLFVGGKGRHAHPHIREIALDLVCQQ